MSASPLRTEPIGTDRLELLPLRPAHADEMAGVLSRPDPRTGRSTGPAPKELRSMYGRIAAGPPDRAVSWCHWVIRLRDAACLTGAVHAVTEPTRRGPVAEVDWALGVAWQGRGIEAEAVRGVVTWLARRPARWVTIRVGDDEGAAVAAAAGLAPTGRGDEEDEEVWQLDVLSGGRSGPSSRP